MLVLLIEMTLPETLLALVDTNSLQVWERKHSSNRASNAIHGYLAELLTESGNDIEDIQQTVVIRGPGSFTGARVGFAIAQGLKSALDIPIKTLNTLQALAISSEHSQVCVLIDSLGKEIYAQSFQNTRPISEPTCLLVEETKLKNGYICIGNGVEKAGLGENTDIEINPLLAVKFAQNTSDEAQPLYLKPLNYKK